MEKYFSSPVCFWRSDFFVCCRIRGKSCAAESKILLERSHEEPLKRLGCLVKRGGGNLCCVRWGKAKDLASARCRLTVGKASFSSTVFKPRLTLLAASLLIARGKICHASVNPVDIVRNSGVNAELVRFAAAFTPTDDSGQFRDLTAYLH